MKKHCRKKTAGKIQLSIAKPGEGIGDLLYNVHLDFRELIVKGGLKIMRELFEADIEALCGPRYVHNGDENQSGQRWGAQRGTVVMGGQKIVVHKPRIRKGGKEVLLPSYEALQREDPLNDRTLEQMIIGVSTRNYARSLDEQSPAMERCAISRSSVSRRFVAMSQARLDATLHAPLDDRNWASLMIDGIQFGEHVIVIALGIDTTGAKHVLGLREGSTENATLCKEMLSDMVSRGLPADQSILIVIDGGKGIRKAVGQVFGSYAVIQRCQVHKRRNVLDQLPAERRPHAKSILEQAYKPTTTVATAERLLRNLAKSLEEKYPGAAASMNEGLDETLAIKSLNLPAALSRSFSTTNAIENLNGTVRKVTQRTKRWRGGKMILRWVATGVFEAQDGFRRVRGHQSMSVLWDALRKRDDQLKGDNMKQVG